jgi:hypothetical protein
MAGLRRPGGVAGDPGPAIFPKKTWDYLGTMMTISLAGALALALMAKVFALARLTDPMVFQTGFMAVVALMFLEHWRRCRVLQLSWMVSASWIAYRLLVLYIITR